MSDIEKRFFNFNKKESNIDNQKKPEEIKGKEEAMPAEPKPGIEQPGTEKKKEGTESGSEEKKARIIGKIKNVDNLADNLIETIKEKLFGKAIKVEDIIEILKDKKSMEKFVSGFGELYKDCIKRFDEIDKDKNIKGEEEKKKAKENFVKGKFRSEEIKIKEGGVDDKKIEKIQKELTKKHKEITKFFIEENRINEERKKNKVQLEGGIRSKINTLIEKRSESGRFDVNKLNELIFNFRKNVEDIYNDKKITEEKRGIEIERKQKEWEGKIADELLGADHRYSESFHTSSRQRNIVFWIEEVTESIVKFKNKIDKKEAELKKESKENIKMLAEAFGLKIDDKTIELMRYLFSGKK